MFRSLLLLSTFCSLGLGLEMGRSWSWNSGFKHRRAGRKASRCTIPSGSYVISNADGVLSMGTVDLELRARKGEPSVLQVEKYGKRRGVAFYSIRVKRNGISYVLSNDLTFLVWDDVVGRFGRLDRVGKFALYDCTKERRQDGDDTTEQFSAKIKNIQEQGFIKAKDEGETEYVPKSNDDQ